MSSEYDQQAEAFLKRFELRFRSTRRDEKCPPFCDGKCHHGDRYRITISRKSGGRLSFDFWNSQNDMASGATSVDPYSVLACISGDIHTPETFEDYCAEYGADEDSRKAYDTFKRVNRFAQRLRAFFSFGDEQRTLAEIQ